MGAEGGLTRSLMDTLHQGGIARVAADRIEKRIDPEQDHVEAVRVDGVVEGGEGLVAITGAKVVNANLICGTGLRRI